MEGERLKTAMNKDMATWRHQLKVIPYYDRYCVRTSGHRQ